MTTGGLGRRPSIKDVAERAGGSFQTVSKVLRGRGSVADLTCSFGSLIWPMLTTRAVPAAI